MSAPLSPPSADRPPTPTREGMLWLDDQIAKLASEWEAELATAERLMLHDVVEYRRPRAHAARWLASHLPSLLDSQRDGECKMADEQIKHMVDRFLGWRLPEDFHPDAGISFELNFNVNTPHPMKHQPIGTNLFTATQAEAMVRYMIDGMPAASPSVSAE